MSTTVFAVSSSSASILGVRNRYRRGRSLQNDLCQTDTAELYNSHENLRQALDAVSTEIVEFRSQYACDTSSSYDEDETVLECTLPIDDIAAAQIETLKEVCESDDVNGQLYTIPLVRLRCTDPASSASTTSIVNYENGSDCVALSCPISTTEFQSNTVSDFIESLAVSHEAVFELTTGDDLRCTLEILDPSQEDNDTTGRPLMSSNVGGSIGNPGPASYSLLAIVTSIVGII